MAIKTRDSASRTFSIDEHLAERAHLLLMRADTAKVDMQEPSRLVTVLMIT